MIKPIYYRLLLIGVSGFLALYLLIQQGHSEVLVFQGYIQEGISKIEVNNLVSAIYLDYRLFDTLFEALLLLVSIQGVFLLTNVAHHEDQQALYQFEFHQEPVFTLIRQILSMIYPFFVILGIYIIVNGADSPGGGFQGGAILAALFMSRYIVSEQYLFNPYIPYRIEKWLFLVLILFIGMVIGGLVPASYSRGFILLINSFIGFEVAAAFTALFLRFVGRD